MADSTDKTATPDIPGTEASRTRPWNVRPAHQACRHILYYVLFERGVGLRRRSHQEQEQTLKWTCEQVLLQTQAVAKPESGDLLEETWKGLLAASGRAMKQPQDLEAARKSLTEVEARCRELLEHTAPVGRGLRLLGLVEHSGRFFQQILLTLVSLAVAGYLVLMFPQVGSLVRQHVEQLALLFVGAIVLLWVVLRGITPYSRRAFLSPCVTPPAMGGSVSLLPRDGFIWRIVAFLCLDVAIALTATVLVGLVLYYIKEPNAVPTPYLLIALLANVVLVAHVLDLVDFYTWYPVRLAGGLVLAALIVFFWLFDSAEDLSVHNSAQNQPWIDVSQWPGTPKADNPVVVVAASGGGSRAAIFALEALLALEEDEELKAISDSIIALSGVSGGSLAIASWLSYRLMRGDNPDDYPSRRDAYRQAISGDFLGPVLTGFLLPGSTRSSSLKDKWKEAPLKLGSLDLSMRGIAR
jgi:hypothetical protein